MYFIMVQSANGLGLEAVSGKDYCQVTINFPKDTVPKWVSLSLQIYLICSYPFEELNLYAYEWANDIQEPSVTFDCHPILETFFGFVKKYYDLVFFFLNLNREILQLESLKVYHLTLTSVRL